MSPNEQQQQQQQQQHHQQQKQRDGPSGGNGESMMEDGLRWFSPHDIRNGNSSKNVQEIYQRKPIYESHPAYAYKDSWNAAARGNGNSGENYDDVSLVSYDDSAKSDYNGAYYYPNYHCANYQRGIFGNFSSSYDSLPLNTKRVITIALLSAAVLIGLNLASVGMNEQMMIQGRQYSQALRPPNIETHHSSKQAGSDSKGNKPLRKVPFQNNNDHKGNRQNHFKKHQNGIVIVNGISISKNKFMQPQHAMGPQGFNQGPQTISQPVGQGQMQTQPLGNQFNNQIPMQSQQMNNQFNSQLPIQNQQMGQQGYAQEQIQTQQQITQDQLIAQMQNQATDQVGGGYITEEGNILQEVSQIVEQTHTNQSPVATSEIPTESVTEQTQDMTENIQQIVTEEAPVENVPEQVQNLTENNQQIVTEEAVESQPVMEEVVVTETVPQTADSTGPQTVEEQTNLGKTDDPMVGFMDGFEGFHMVPLEDLPNEQSFNEPTEVVVDEEGDNNDSFLDQVVETNVLIGKPKINEDGSVPLEELKNFKDNWDPWERSDVPVFLHIPKAGGSTIKDLMGTCHRFVMATETGITDGHDDDPEVAVVYPGGGPVGQDRSPFVNVDTTTLEGIARAKEMGFADSGLADAVVTPFIYEANDLFTPTAKGRLFTVFRHPIDRAISMFYYIQIADWEPTYDPELKDWTIAQYAQSDKVENNWLTRSLSNQMEGDLNEDNVKIAMEVIRRKFMVGLMTQIEETMERFERFFHWTYHVNPPNQEKCREGLVAGGSNKNSSKKDKPQPGSEDWELLVLQNRYDLQLYEYIEVLFKEQEQFVADIPVGFRLQDATCCKCGPPTFPPEGFTCPLAIMN